MGKVDIIRDAKVSERKILLVPVDTIRRTPYNPPSRTKDGVAMRKLANAIKEHGLQYPLLINAERDLIDGNRRLTACKLLGIEMVECVIAYGDTDAIFRDINTSAISIAGKGWLYIGRTGGKLPSKEAAMCKELMDMMGAYGIDNLIAANIGLNILPLCRSVCAHGTNHRLADVILSCAKGRLSNKLNAILRSDKPRETKRLEMDALLFPASTKQEIAA